MLMNMMKSVKLLACTTVAFSLLAAANVSAKEIEKTFDVSEGGTFKLETNRGSIKVGTHDKDQVIVMVDIDGSDEDDMKVSFDSSGSDVTVVGEQSRESKGFWGRNNLRVSFYITVPSNYNLDVDTAGGSIKIADLNGKVDAHTSGGSIKLGRISGEVNVNTSGGSIKVEEVAGNIRAHTSGGSVKATLTKQPTGDCKLTTSGGSITVYLADDIAVDLSARTSGGRVRSEFDVNGDTTKRSIRGAINGGGPKLTLKTSGGSVKVLSL